MPPANVEIVRRFWELATVHRDFDAAMELTHADVEFDWSDSRAPYRGVYRGSDEMKGAWQAWLEAWDEWKPEVVEAIEVDPGTVVVVTQVYARGKGSGVPVSAEGASVWSIRDGKILRGKLFQSKFEALASVKYPAT
jgi:ketosteroid isomerase-like protein